MNLNCHCGNIKIETCKNIEFLTSCNCSICNRYGSLWGYFLPEEVSISFEKEPNFYSHGDKNVEFYFCTTCGCLTHYKTTKKVKDPKIGVNFRMLKLELLENLKIRKFDGANTWKFLD
ncbi:MAG: aldehyde-activating protein [Candidatus Sericytochromatia bacterium]